MTKERAGTGLKTMRVAVVASMLSEASGENSATRQFAGGAVLAHTLSRVAAAVHASASLVVAWDDQVAAVRAAAPRATVLSRGVRAPSVALRETEASLRWADGWRGALLGRTAFDRGFDAAAIAAALDASACDAALLVDPSAVLADAGAIDRLIEHLDARPQQPYAFTPGAVGYGAMLLRRVAIDDLARAGRGPGSLVTYHPDRVAHDPIAKSFAAAVPPRVARSSARLTADSRRQLVRLTQLPAGDAASVIDLPDRRPARDASPRDVVVELTTRRATRPAWSILSTRDVTRPDLTLERARALFAQLAEADDVRITFAGVGDPLLHPRFEEIVSAARTAGIDALHVETDLLPDDAARIDSLARGGVDVVSFHLPAAHASTYARLMGVDRMRDVLDNVRRLLIAREGRVPILAATFVKCEANVGEMEAWYDQWVRALGAAMIVGPSDLSGRVAYAGVADMTPTVRRGCRRLDSRVTILSDGTVASCEEDVLGEQSCGDAADVLGAWGEGSAPLRSLHAERRWDESILCRSCRMWDRP